MFDSEFLNAIVNNVEEKFKNISIEDLKRMHEEDKNEQSMDRKTNN